MTRYQEKVLCKMISYIFTIFWFLLHLQEAAAKTNFKLISQLHSATEGLNQQHMHQEIIDAKSTAIQDDYENKKIHDGPILSQMPDFFKRTKLIDVDHLF